MVETKMPESKEEIRYRSKVTKGFRVVIPKDIVKIYKVKENNIVEWIYDSEGNTRIEIKEMILRDKKAKVERVYMEEGKRLHVERVNKEEGKEVKVEEVIGNSV